MKNIYEYLIGNKKKNIKHLEVNFNDFNNTCSWLDFIGFKKVNRFSKQTLKNKPEYKVENQISSKHINSYFIGNDGKEYGLEFNFGHLTWARLVYFVIDTSEKRFVEMFGWKPDEEKQEDIAKKIVEFVEKNI